MIVTCVDNDLAELSSLEELCLISRRSSWLDDVVDEIQSCTSCLRFLRMIFWSVLTLDDTDDDQQIKLIFVPVNNTISKNWGKSRKVAPFPLVSTRSEYDRWILDLQGRIQDSKKMLAESCQFLLSHGSLRCNFLHKKKHTGKFLDAILQNLKDLYKYKSGDVSVLLKKQIATLENKLTMLHDLFELTPKEWRSSEEMLEFKVLVHDFAYYSACMVFLYWVKLKAIDEDVAAQLNVLSFNVLQKYRHCAPILKAFYFRFLNEVISSKFDPLILGRTIQVILDLLLDNLADVLNGDFRILEESLMFVIAFLADQPSQYADDEELMMITAEIEDLDNEDLYFLLSVDDTKEENLSKANGLLKEFMRKVEQVKGNIRKFYDRIRDSFSYDFPKINGLGFFDFILQNVGSLIDQMNRDKYFIPFAKHLIMEIEEGLVSLRPYLDDLFEQQKEHKELNNTWLKVIDLAYQSEYAINSCMVAGNALWYNMAGLMVVLDKLRDVKSELENMEGKKMDDRGILDRSSIALNKVPKDHWVSGSSEVMVDLKKELDTIVDNLTRGSKSVDIVAIVGMPGLGKTTLANQVYNAPMIRRHFHVLAYCIVSQVHNVRRILLDILADIKGKDDRFDDMSEVDLGRILRNCLTFQRYLIIMDDIWDIQSWDAIKSSLPNNRNGSKVIFTSRIHNIALLANRDSIIHPLRLLSDEESWELLRKRAFQAEEGCPPDFLEVGKMIAEKCKGLPLTIVSIAGVLARTERSLSWWNNISESVSSHVLMDVMSVLELSYQHLPEHLKPCFLYFGVFAKDTIIRVGKLTLLWIAEGFVRNSEGRNLKCVAIEYLCDLVGRSLVIACVRSSNGGIKSCQIHDLVHTFCQVKAQEENFFQFIDGDEGSSSSSSTIHNPYRVCIHMKGKYPKEAPKICSNIHSLLSTAVHDAGNLKLVQVMELKDLIRWGNLKPVHLRFLAGPSIPGARIPYSISNLWNLEYLILRGTSVLQLPESFWNMAKLIHVDVGQCHLSNSGVKKSEAFPQMVNLESFSSPTVYSTKDLEEVLQRSPSLVKLSFHYEYEEELEKISRTLVYNEPRKDFHFPNLDSLSKLESLKVSSTKELRLHPFEFPSTLKKLTLSGGNLPWGYLQAVSKLPCLEVLKLLNNAFAGPKWDMEDTEFPKLKFLKLDGLELGEWIAYVESFPSLEVLFVAGCDELEAIPPCLGEMLALKRIEMLGSHKDATKVVETAEQIPLPLEEEMAPLKRIEGFGSSKTATRVHETEEQIVLENLIDFILYNFNLIGGRLDDNIKKVVDDLHLLKAFARGYSKIDTDSDAVVQKLANDVRDVVYQAEDAIEDCIIYQTLKKNRGVGSKALRLLGFRDLSDFKQIGKQIQVVSAKGTVLMKKRAPLELEALKDAAPAPYKGVKKKKVPVVEEDNVVGFEDEAEKVITLLTGGEAQELEIISIIGMLGLGKTTLAKKVLSDPKVEYDFFFRVFVNVSLEYEKRDVFINILRAFNCTITPDMLDNEIMERLHKELGKWKYLIVLDDVWDEDAWDDLKVAFPNNNKGSRILITSRNMRVASHANPSTNAHELRFMTGDESRELLRRKVFVENERPHQLEKYEVHILKICGGLPLAIVVVAGILLNHWERTEWWEKVSESLGDIVAREQSQIKDMIKLSLEHLAYQKKACFLYLGVFREEFEIPVWKLLRLWIAEGFIQKDGDMTLEDIAEDYLEDLVDRSLVIVGQRRSNGQIKTCRIHDILRDFCKKEAPKQNMFLDVKASDQSALQSCRRICVNSDVRNYLASKPTGGRVGSFLTFAKEETALPVELVSSIPKAFGRLRVLDAKSLKFPRFPAKLMDLVLLKYIAMSIDFKIIPLSFSNLINLQTVIIDTTSHTLEIKADISKLALLRHLQTNAAASLQKGKASVANPNLQTLCTISPESCTAEMFERYPKLKKLGIRGKLATVILANGESTLFDNLVKLEFLENLKLDNDGTSQFHVLPRETSFPRNLRRLTLMNTFLVWAQISTVGKLQNLEVLKLKDNAFDGELWLTEDGGFRCLKVLHIGYTHKLVLWKANASHFPMLTSLYLRHCDNLEAIPHGIASIPSLHTIDLFCCSKPSVAVSARKIQLLKLQKAHQKNSKTFHFKLAVFPPDQ